MTLIQYIDLNNDTFNDNFFESAYYYWCNKLELNKLISFEDNLKYIPCYPYENIKYADTIGKNILIFLKNPKILYGISNIKSILIKEQREKTFLDFDSNILNTTSNDLGKLVEIDEKLYLNLINKYNMVEIPGLFFIRLDYIDIFEFEIDIKSYNQYLNMEIKSVHDILSTKNYKMDELEFNYPKKVKTKHISISYYKYFQTFLLDYIGYLKKKMYPTLPKEKNNLLIQDNTLLYSNLESNTENINKTNANIDEIVNFSIPILWNGCDKIFKKFKKQKIDKELIYTHWDNCDKCEIINNNINKFEIKNKKIVIKNIKSKNNFIILDKIMEDYKNIRKFSHSKINSDFEFDSYKTNIIYCFESNSIYKNCFFILW